MVQQPFDNPYEVLNAGETVSESAYPTGESDFQITGDLIVCGHSVSLPGCCVKTGATEDLIRYEHKTLRRIPPITILLLFFMAPGWVLYAVIWYFSSTRCVVSFSLSRSYLATRRMLMIVGLVAAGVGQFLALSGVVDHPMTVIGGILLFSAGLFVFLRSVLSPIWITRHQHKQRFWLSGCSRTALNAIEQIQKHVALS
ncbi:MAG: hypothetical protein JNM43_23930 [Planctomycetaceae bacterium]|nr:hypothetical protein [Planctomycetaceae bacterium]